MDKNFLENIKSRVESGEVKQVSRRQVLAHHHLLWGYVVLAVLFSSLALGRIFFLIDTSDLPLWQHIFPSFSAFIIATFPYLWTILGLVFVALSADRVRKTEFGYRYTWSYILSSVIGLSIVGGFLLYAIGIGQLMESIDFERKNFDWQSPQEGRLSGMVSDVSSTTVVLKDGSGNAWQVTYDNPTVGKRLLVASSTVRAIGFVREGATGSSEFVACVFVPAEGRKISREVMDRFDNKVQSESLATSSSFSDDRKEFIERCTEVLKKGRASVPPPICCKPNTPRN
jgi:hypothetical protein